MLMCGCSQITKAHKTVPGGSLYPSRKKRSGWVLIPSPNQKKTSKENAHTKNTQPWGITDNQVLTDSGRAGCGHKDQTRPTYRPGYLSSPTYANPFPSRQCWNGCFCKARKPEDAIAGFCSRLPLVNSVCWATCQRPKIGQGGMTTTQRRPCWEGTMRWRRPAQFEGGGGERPRYDGASSLCSHLLYTLGLCVERTNKRVRVLVLFRFGRCEAGWQANHRRPRVA